MESSVSSGRFFLAGILVSSLLMTPGILDLTLIPRFILLALLLLLCLFFFYRREWMPAVRFDAVICAYTAYVLFCSCTFFWARNGAEALFEINKTWLAYFTFLFAFYFLQKKEAAFFKGILISVVIISVLSATMALYQLFTLPDLKKESMYFVTGLNGHKNLLSSFLFLQSVFLCLVLREFKAGWKITAIVCLLANLIIIALLRSKAVWIGAAACILVFVFMNLLTTILKKRSLKISPFIIAAVLVVIANLFFLKVLDPAIKKGIDLNAKNSSGKNSLLDQERMVVWDKTYQVLQKRPLTGLGAGNWQVFFPDAGLTGLWRVEDLNVTFQRPHNDFLWILSESGLIGFNLYLLFIFLLLAYSVKAMRMQSDPHIAYRIAAYTSCATGYFVISFFDFPKERIEHLIWINIVFALLYFRARPLLQEYTLFTLKPSQRLALTACALLLFIFSTGLLRFRGEYYTSLMYDYKNSNDLPGIVRSGKSAWSFAYTLDPTSVPIHWYIGNANASMNNYIDAQQDFLKAYSYNPCNRNVLNDLASAYAFNKEPETAKEFYKEAARISPRFDEAKLNLAALYITEGKPAEADVWLKSLLHDSERRTNYQKLVDVQLQRHK